MHPSKIHLRFQQCFHKMACDWDRSSFLSYLVWGQHMCWCVPVSCRWGIQFTNTCCWFCWVVNRLTLLFFSSCFHLQWGEIWGTAPCIHLQSKIIPRSRQFWEEGKDKEHPDIMKQQSVSKAYPSSVSQLPAERGSQPCRQQLHCQGTKLQSQMFLLEVHYTELGRWVK